MDITALLKMKFPDAEITLGGEDCASKLVIVSSEFEGLSRLNRHKLVLGVLTKQFQSGELHALSLSIKTPSESGS